MLGSGSGPPAYGLTGGRFVKPVCAPTQRRSAHDQTFDRPPNGSGDPAGFVRVLARRGRRGAMIRTGSHCSSRGRVRPPLFHSADCLQKRCTASVWADTFTSDVT